MNSKRDLLSIIVPALNEEDNLPRVHQALTAVMERATDCDYEVIIMDNASTDGTPRVAEALCARDARWRYIRLSRNFSAEHSIMAGLYYCTGDAAVILVSDLQEPPELILDFLARWREGYEIVYGRQTARHGESKRRGIFSGLFYKLISHFSEIDLPEGASDFRLMDRKVVDALCRMTERNRYLRGLSHWTGFRQIGLPYARSRRRHGRSKSSPFFLWSYAIQAICSFSARPLRYVMVLGAVILLLTVLGGIGYFLAYVFAGARAAGITTVVLLILADIGLTMFGIGLLGEYIAHIYTEAKGRPLWIVDKALNIDIPDDRRYGP